MLAGPAFRDANEFQRLLGANGVPTDYWDLQVTPSEIDKICGIHYDLKLLQEAKEHLSVDPLMRIFNSIIPSKEVKKVTSSGQVVSEHVEVKSSVIAWLNSITQNSMMMRRNEKVLIHSANSNRGAMQFSSFLMSIYGHVEFHRVATIRSHMYPLSQVQWKLRNLLEETRPDLIVVHSFDLDATRERVQLVRDLLDSLDDVFLIVVATAENSIDVEQVLRREFDRTIAISTKKIF
jgi:hypothetical protein